MRQLTRIILFYKKRFVEGHNQFIGIPLIKQGRAFVVVVVIQFNIENNHPEGFCNRFESHLFLGGVHQLQRIKRFFRPLPNSWGHGFCKSQINLPNTLGIRYPYIPWQCLKIKISCVHFIYTVCTCKQSTKNPRKWKSWGGRGTHLAKMLQDM